MSKQEMKSKYLSDAQIDRLKAGWDDVEYERINAQYPEADEIDFVMADDNVADSVWGDTDIDPSCPMSVMELYAASIEAIMESKS